MGVASKNKIFKFQQRDPGMNLVTSNRLQSYRQIQYKTWLCYKTERSKCLLTFENCTIHPKIFKNFRSANRSRLQHQSILISLKSRCLDIIIKSQKSTSCIVVLFIQTFSFCFTFSAFISNTDFRFFNDTGVMQRPLMSVFEIFPKLTLSLMVINGH